MAASMECCGSKSGDGKEAGDTVADAVNRATEDGNGDGDGTRLRVSRRRFFFVGPSLAIFQDHDSELGQDMYLPLGASTLAADIATIERGTGAPPPPEQLDRLTARVLEPVFQEVAYSALVPIMKAVHGIAVSKTEGSCLEFNANMDERLRSLGLRSHYLAANAPPFRRKGSNADRFSHVAVLVPTDTAFVLLDPALYVNQPIVLSRENGYQGEFYWPTGSAMDDIAAAKRGLRWQYHLDLENKRLDVHAEFPNSLEGLKPLFHFWLKGVAPPDQDVALNLAGERNRYSVLRMDKVGNKVAQLAINPPLSQLESYTEGAQPERLFLPFDALLAADRPLLMMLEWMGAERVSALKLDDPLESIATIAAIASALTAPPTSMDAAHELRAAHHAKAALKAREYWAKLPPVVAADLKMVMTVQPPWGKALLSGASSGRPGKGALKTVETRTYPYPLELLGKRIEVLQTLESTAGVSSTPDRVAADDPLYLVIGSLVVSECFLYSTHREWELDYARHKVPPSNPYGWSEKKDYFGWVLTDVELYATPRPTTAMQRVHRSFFLKSE